MAFDNQIESFSGVLLSSIIIQRDERMKPVVVKKASVNLYNSEGKIIQFKRIDWFKRNILSDKDIVHFDSEFDLLKNYKDTNRDEVLYIYGELDDNYKNLKIVYHLIYEIDGKKFEIKESRDLHRKDEWIWLNLLRD